MRRLLLICAWLLPALVRVQGAPLVLDRSQSRIEVTVDTTIDSFVAELSAYTLTVSLSHAPTGPSTADLRFHFADLKTGNEDRDREMNRWQKSAEFPDGWFHLTHLDTLAAGHYLAHGQLQFHGTTCDVVFPLTVTTHGPILALDGSAPLDTRDFGLPIFRKFLLFKVEPVVQVRFHLQGRVTAP